MKILGRRAARKREEELQRRAAARRWQSAAWDWSQLHPGEPLMNAALTNESAVVEWNGPRP